MPMQDEEVGELSVLNCTSGDIHIKFDKDDPADVATACKIINDMQRRGYILVVEHGGQHHRVDRFDPNTTEYIIREASEAPPTSATIRVARKTGTCQICKKPISPGQSYYAVYTNKTHVTCGVVQIKPKKKTVTRRLPMKRSRATGIAPTAGG